MVALFVVAIRITVPWIDLELDRGRLIAVGVGWLLATVLFELGFGHWIAEHPWSRILADYHLLPGGLWLLVLQ